MEKSEKMLRKLTKKYEISQEESVMYKKEKKKTKKCSVTVQPCDATHCEDPCKSTFKTLDDIRSLIDKNNKILQSISKLNNKYYANKIRGRERAKTMRLKSNKRKSMRILRNQKIVHCFLVNSYRQSSRKQGRKCVCEKCTNNPESDYHHVSDNVCSVRQTGRYNPTKSLPCTSTDTTASDIFYRKITW
ncbi:unnamed protein product, partial [Owenia fusiformis]